MKVRVRFFAALRQVTGQEMVEMEVASGATASELLDALIADYPNLSRFGKVIQVAINQEFAQPGTRIQPNDEVALLPPVSGGR